jgi:hypothetical protein
MKSSATPPPSKTNFGGQKSLFRHLARMGNCPQSHLHRLHRHLHRRWCLPWWGGSSSPPGLRALLVAMWIISLSHDVIYMWSWSLYLVGLVDVVLHLIYYSSGFIIVISRDTLYHDVKVIVCALCVSLRLNFAVILVTSYDLSWMSLLIVGVCWNHLVHSRWQCGVILGNVNFEECFVALCMISVCYSTGE